MSQGYTEDEVDDMSIPTALVLAYLGPIRRQMEHERIADAVAVGICKAFEGG